MKINLAFNIKEFSKRYSFTKDQYKIIISGKDGCGKSDLINSIIESYFENYHSSKNFTIYTNPDVFYLSPPIYDRSGKIIRTLTTEERLICKFGFIDKIDGNRVGAEITIDQIREMINFISLTSTYRHKFIIINSADDLNKEASAALLKTLEETSVNSIFLLLSTHHDYLTETIKSRCQIFEYFDNTEPYKGTNFLDYFLLKYPKLEHIIKNNDYVDFFNDIENDLSLLKSKKINPLVLSEKWVEKGYIVIDYISLLFYLLLKGPYLDKNSTLNNLYHLLHKKISLTTSNTLNISKFLLKMKKSSFFNVNKKLFFDDLLIVLNKNL